MARWLACLPVVLVWWAPAPAAEVPNALVGRWVSQDDDRRPVEFAKDGTCKYGWEKNAAGEWQMAAGKFEMEAADRARFRIEHGGVVLGRWFRLKDGHLETPKDVRPTIWRKAEAK